MTWGGIVEEKENYTYILKCRDGSYYTGWTNDLEKRVKAHNLGKGARYTRSRRPVSLVYYECFSCKEEAMHREWEIKQMSRREKENLVAAAASTCNPGYCPTCRYRLVGRA